MKKFLIFMGVLLLAGFTTVAQQTITGRVTNAESGDPIPGVSVVVKQQATVGTSTDMDGEYSLQVPEDAQSLVFSFVGMIKQEIPIRGRTVIDVELEPAVEEMEEVVVTALGISRERKALGYSVQDVSGEDLTQVPESNLLNSMTGKVAGVQITSASGAVGSSTRITIRGNNSFGENQPLFVVDGTPVSNFSTDVDQFGDADFGNAAMDIDPENIKSISILKGANASAIYGSRAANGVVLITTKSGQKQKAGIGVSYTYTSNFSKPYILPDYQNKYGQGLNGSEYLAQAEGINVDNLEEYNQYAVNNSYAYGDGNPGSPGTFDYLDESWGPRLDIGLEIPQFNSPYSVDGSGNVTYQATPWISHPNNVESFFRTGVAQSHNLSLSGGVDEATGRLSITQDINEGTIPNTDLTKTSINLSGNVKLGNRLNAQFKTTYVKNHSDNIPYNGYDAGNVMQSIGGWFGRQVNMSALEANWNKLDPFGKPYTWSYYYHDNPYWTVNRKPTERTRDRIFGNAQLRYTITDWLNATARFGTDYFTESRKRSIWEMSNENKNNGGQFWENKRTLQETNFDFIVNFDKTFGEDLRLDGLAGAHYRKYDYNYSLLEAAELTVPNFFHISNVSGSATTDQTIEESEQNSVYGQVNLSYKDFLFIGGTARNDWSSTLPSDNWSYFYPSGNLNVVFTELFDIPVLSFGKIFTSYAIVGNDTNPYQLRTNYGASTNTFLGVTQYFISRELANSDLKPEKTKSFEIGTNLQFLNGRLGLDFTYYDQITTDQILSVEIPASSGYESRVINAGEIENEGIEISAFANILKSPNGFNWRLNVNWSKNSNTVNKLYRDLESYQINRSWGGVSVEARPGDPLGVIMAEGFLKDDNGNYVVDATGRPMSTANPVNAGNITPDWVGGIRNSFSYKGLTFSALIDGRKGGDIFSVTKMFGLYAGILDETAKGDTRENGLIAGEDVLTGKTFVKEDGSPNDIVVSPQSFWSRFYSVKEHNIIDGSYIKLRELTLGYTFPKKWLDRIGFIQNLTLSAYARNVAVLYLHDSNDIPIDPETAFGATLQGQGLEQFQIPPSRVIGLKVSTRF
jgi:TonB-linked SusC/RagA family outer membrane protein